MTCPGLKRKSWRSRNRRRRQLSCGARQRPGSPLRGDPQAGFGLDAGCAPHRLALIDGGSDRPQPSQISREDFR
jgi:hypothetical protein